jgi:hypothetical protein
LSVEAIVKTRDIAGKKVHLIFVGRLPAVTFCKCIAGCKKESNNKQSDKGGCLHGCFSNASGRYQQLRIDLKNVIIEDKVLLRFPSHPEASSSSRSR